MHLSVPAIGENSPPDAPLASVFFFAGSAQELIRVRVKVRVRVRVRNRNRNAHPNPHPNPNTTPNPGSAQELGACGHTCVSVWWGADPAFEQGLLLDLRALHQLSKGRLPQTQQLARLAVSREEILCELGERTELGRDRIVLEARGG